MFDNFGNFPVFEAIEYQKPARLFEFFANRPWSFLIDGADGASHAYGTHRYGYILLDPFARFVYRVADDTKDPLLLCRQLAHHHQMQSLPGIPPFQGGMAGYLSYDLVDFYERKKHSQRADLNAPDLCIGFYDLILSFDHLEEQAYIVSSGFPLKNLKQRFKKAQDRRFWLKRQLDEARKSPSYSFDKQSHPRPVLHSNFTKAAYLAAVKKMIEYIRAGDIFEANLAQRFSALLPDDFQTYALYQELSRINPAPFAAYLNLGAMKILSASPERFLRAHLGLVETRPIKGTRSRLLDPTQDALNINDLLSNSKDRAENIMIVDLMRNDLSQVCEDDSVFVTQLCGHEQYPTVHHLVSVIQGQLRSSEDRFSLLKACFPGGSITGAPKIRAMQIIAELEPHRRGPYCGSIVLIGFNDFLDASIIIRSFVIKKNLLTYHVGGAVVLDSNPEAEYEETLTKGDALSRALGWQ